MQCRENSGYKIEATVTAVGHEINARAFDSRLPMRVNWRDMFLG